MTFELALVILFIAGVFLVALTTAFEIADILICRYGHRLQSKLNRTRLTCRRCHTLIQDVRPMSHHQHLL